MADRKSNINEMLKALGSLDKNREVSSEEMEADSLVQEALEDGSYEDDLVEDVEESFDVGEGVSSDADEDFDEETDEGEEEPYFEESSFPDEPSSEPSEPESLSGEEGFPQESSLPQDEAEEGPSSPDEEEDFSGAAQDGPSDENLPEEDVREGENPLEADGSEALGDEDGEEGDEDEESDESDPYGEYNVNDYEDDILNTEDEAMQYSSSSDEISIEDMFGPQGQEGQDEEEGDDDDDVPEKKQNALDVLGVKKKKKEIPKLAKTKLMVFLGIGTLAFLIVFNLSFLSGKGKKDKKKAASDVAVDGYKPDFGDYQAREYKPTKKDKEKDDIEYINRMLTQSKKEEEKPAEKVVYQSQPQAVSADNSEAVNTWKTARDSPIRYSGSGFGSKNEGSPSPVMDALGLQGLSSGQASSYPSYPGQPMSYDQYAGSYVDRLAALAGGQSGGGYGYDKINNGRFSQDGAYDRKVVGGQMAPIPEYSLYPGTIIPAVMVSGINTDYPGNITARITSPVYDSRTGKNLLIPQGSILRGSYSSSSIGVAKVQIAWQTLIINRDGYDYIVNLGSMVGVDARGYSGIKGSLNDHFFQYVKAAGISSLFTYINSNIYSYTKAQKSMTLQQMISDSQEIGNKLADKILDRALDIQPTVVVKPGTRVYVDVDQVLTLIPQNLDVPVQKYVKK